jgi:hypothetical protein
VILFSTSPEEEFRSAWIAETEHRAVRTVEVEVEVEAAAGE